MRQVSVAAVPTERAITALVGPRVVHIARNNSDETLCPGQVLHGLRGPGWVQFVYRGVL